MYEYTWPDVLRIEINGKFVKEYCPLLTNSSLKKRKDDRIVVKEANLIQKGEN